MIIIMMMILIMMIKIKNKMEGILSLSLSIMFSDIILGGYDQPFVLLASNEIIQCLLQDNPLINDLSFEISIESHCIHVTLSEDAKEKHPRRNNLCTHALFLLFSSKENLKHFFKNKRSKTT